MTEKRRNRKGETGKRRTGHKGQGGVKERLRGRGEQGRSREGGNNK